MKKLLLLLLIWGGAVSFWVLTNNIYVADRLAEKSMQYLSKLDTEVAERLIDKAIEKNKYEPNYYRIKAKILTVGEGDKKEILNNLQRSLDLNKNNLVTARNSVSLYYFLSIKNFNEPLGTENIDTEYLPTTHAYFLFMKEKYPNDAGVISLIAKYEKKLGLMEDYARSVEIIRNLRPDLLDWYESFR